MMALMDDQAAGLRRLFRAAPPEVLSVVPCGTVATQWLARQLHVRAKAGISVMALDEWAACGNLADCLGVSPRFDLLQVVDGHIDIERSRVEAAPGLCLLPVSRLSRALGQDRITQQRTAERLRSLQGQSDEWFVHARPCDIHGLSPLALAAPRMLLAVDPQPKALTQAYATLKRLRQGADTSAISLVMTGALTPESRCLAANLRALARRQLGLEIAPVSSLGEALAHTDQSDRPFAVQPYLERLIDVSRAMKASALTA